MKIVILLKRWKGGVGGGITNISEEMKKLGHEVDIIAREEDLKIYSFLGSILKLRNTIKELMKKKNYDIIYTQDWSLAFPLMFPYKIYESRHYCMFHGNQFGIGSILQTTIGKNLNEKLIVMAPSLKKRFPKASLVYCGVNYKKRFKPLHMKRKYFGWIEKETEVMTRKELEEICDSLGTPLLIAKNIPYEEMNEFYNKCKIFMSLPTPAAGFNASYLEAMAAGVPIIIGNNEGAGTILPFDKVIKKEDAMNTITQIIKNPKKVDYRKWIISNDLSWENHTKKLLELFNRH